MSYPAYVPRVLHALAKTKPFGIGQGYALVHPVLHYQLAFVEQVIHEIAHVVLLCRDDDLAWLSCYGDDRRLVSNRISKSLTPRNDRPRQECMALAVEYWILKHWGFRFIDSWLGAAVGSQPRSVTFQRVMHHLTHPVKRRHIVEQAHRTLCLIRHLVKYWRECD